MHWRGLFALARANPSVGNIAQGRALSALSTADDRTGGDPRF